MRAQTIINEFSIVPFGDNVRTDVGWYLGAYNNFVPAMGEMYLNNRFISIRYINAGALPEIIYICRNGI